MFGSIFRKLRGIVGTGMSWAVGWGIVGTALQWSLSLLGVVGSPDMLVEPFMYGLLGFYGGSVFGGVLALTEGKRSLPELRLGRVAVWGALAGISIPVVFHLLGGGAGLSWFSQLWTSPDLWISLGIIAPLGAASAAGMTAVARSGSEGLIEEAVTQPPLPRGDGEER